MTHIISREIRLASRPAGLPTAANFAFAQTEPGPPQDGQVLVRNLFMSPESTKPRKPSSASSTGKTSGKWW